jgi:hypothetical protein
MLLRVGLKRSLRGGSALLHSTRKINVRSFHSFRPLSSKENEKIVLDTKDEEKNETEKMGLMQRLWGRIKNSKSATFVKYENYVCFYIFNFFIVLVFIFKNVNLKSYSALSCM